MALFFVGLQKNHYLCDARDEVSREVENYQPIY